MQMKFVDLIEEAACDSLQDSEKLKEFYEKYIDFGNITGNVNIRRSDLESHVSLIVCEERQNAFKLGFVAAEALMRGETVFNI